MATAEESRSTSRMLTLASVAFVIGLLYFARDILLPFAMAILVSFLLAPIVIRLQRAGLGRVPAVILVVTLALSTALVTGVIVVRQLLDLTEKLPSYKHELVQKVSSLRSEGDGPFQKVKQTIQDLQREFVAGEAAEAPKDVEPQAPDSDRVFPDATVPSRNGQSELAGEEEPINVRVVTPVEVTGNQSSPLQFVKDWLGPLLVPLGTAGLVTVFVVFMLIQREDLRNRLIRLIGEANIQGTTEALDDAAHRVSRYLLMQLIVNATYGAAVALGLFVLGLPNAFLWGLLATILRFVPYVGPWIAAVTPIVLSLAVFDGWGKPLLVCSMFVVLELVSNNVMEPLLYGSSTGVSAVGIIASAVFWTWLWGGMGLVLATPLTVCLTVLGRRIPQLAFLNVLLSDEPALTIEGRVYQRLLALDHDEAENLVDEYLKEHSRLQVYDEVLLPTLRLAERDRHRGRLTTRQQEFLYRSVREMVEEIDEEREWGIASPEPDSLAVAASDEDSDDAPRVFCVPARDEADEIAGLMFTHALRERGYTVEAATDDTLAAEQADVVARKNVPVVVISALPPAAAMHARYRCKRLRPAREDVKLVVGLWTMGGTLRKTRERLTASGADGVVTTVTEAIEEVRRFMAPVLVARQAHAASQPVRVADDD